MSRREEDSRDKWNNGLTTDGTDTHGSKGLQKSAAGHWKGSDESLPESVSILSHPWLNEFFAIPRTERKITGGKTR